MLKVTNVTVNKEATVEVGNTTYHIIYLIVNDIISNISCSIRRKIGEGETASFNEVGIIRKENGQINSNILDTEDFVSHHKQFASIVSEIEKSA